ncbi:hypothetical protein M5K25_002544 [Dendrobium thyrsiflorum]|uniref:Uncharacterized protein n=1 Tax=Dendrobium thyrsiflorum TaxID=117978 RepID=A0ABD0VNJ8_DENTH
MPDPILEPIPLCHFEAQQYQFHTRVDDYIAEQRQHNIRFYDYMAQQQQQHAQDRTWLVEQFSACFRRKQKESRFSAGFRRKKKEDDLPIVLDDVLQSWLKQTLVEDVQSVFSVRHPGSLKTLEVSTSARRNGSLPASGGSKRSDGSLPASGGSERSSGSLPHRVGGKSVLKLKKVHASLKLEFLNLEKEHESLRNKHRTIDSDYMKLVDEFDSLNAKHENLTSEHETLLKKFSDLSSEHENLKTLHVDLERNFKELDALACVVDNEDRYLKIYLESSKKCIKFWKEKYNALEKNKPPPLLKDYLNLLSMNLFLLQSMFPLNLGREIFIRINLEILFLGEAGKEAEEAQPEQAPDPVPTPAPLRQHSQIDQLVERFDAFETQFDTFEAQQQQFQNNMHEYREETVLCRLQVEAKGATVLCRLQVEAKGVQVLSLTGTLEESSFGRSRVERKEKVRLSIREKECEGITRLLRASCIHAPPVALMSLGSSLGREASRSTSLSFSTFSRSEKKEVRFSAFSRMEKNVKVRCRHWEGDIASDTLPHRARKPGHLRAYCPNVKTHPTKEKGEDKPKYKKNKLKTLKAFWANST